MDLSGFWSDGHEVTLASDVTLDDTFRSSTMSRRRGACCDHSPHGSKTTACVGGWDRTGRMVRNSTRASSGNRSKTADRSAVWNECPECGGPAQRSRSASRQLAHL